MTIYHKHHIIPKHMGGTDDPSNLVKVTVEEHAALHKQLWEDLGHWEDKLAWKMLSGLMTREDLVAEKIKMTQIERVENGTHHFLTLSKKRVQNGTHPFLSSEWQSKYSKKRVEEGTHHFLGGEVQRIRVKNGTHLFADKKWQKENAEKRKRSGTHNMVNKITCPVCKKKMQQPLFIRWGHGENCKSNIYK